MNEQTFHETFSNALYAFRNKGKLSLPSTNIIAYLGRKEVADLQNNAHFFSFGYFDIEKNYIEYMECEIIRVEKDNYFAFGIKDF